MYCHPGRQQREGIAQEEPFGIYPAMFVPVSIRRSTGGTIWSLACSQEVIGVFASEYVVASFDDVRRVLEGPAFPGMRITGAMTQRSRTLASMQIEWCDASSPASWQAGELRILRVQSGKAPLTEMLLVAPSPSPTPEGGADARGFLRELGKRVEESVATLPGTGRLPQPASLP